MEHNTIKEYSNGEITIEWEAKKCAHAGKCVKNNPDVFKPKQKPWINADASSSEMIMAAIDQCPSGALRYRKNN